MSNFYDQSVLNKSRKDKFILILNLPEELRPHNKRGQRTNNTLNLDTLQFSIYGIVAPKNNIPAEDVRYSGGNVYMSSHNKPSYEPLAVNFTIDNEFNNYWVIHKWLDLLRNQKTGLYDGVETIGKDLGRGKYATDFTIIAKDEYNNDVIKWIYKSAFPITLGEINYSYRDAGEIETSFEFVFNSVETKLIQN